MKNPLPIILSSIVGQLPPRGASASLHALGTIQIAVQSNETLSLITEFNHTTERIRYVRLANENNATSVERHLIASRLALEFDVCFPEEYCPTAAGNLHRFESTFSGDICGTYCNEDRYHNVLEALSVCEAHTSRNGNGCINFGLTIQASSKSEAEDIRRELGASIAGSRSAFRELLCELAPEFGGCDVYDPDILGYDVSEEGQGVWYPSWHKGQELCSDDGNEPFYMKLDPDEYLAPTMTDCCRKHYWWDVRGCAAPEERPCPEGFVPTDEDVGWNPLMSGKYYGAYPNIMYSGCKPVTSSSNRDLEDDLDEEANRRELREQEQEYKLKALLERQKRLEKLMPPSSRQPPAHVDWKPQRLR